MKNYTLAINLATSLCFVYATGASSQTYRGEATYNHPGIYKSVKPQAQNAAKAASKQSPARVGGHNDRVRIAR